MVAFQRERRLAGPDFDLLVDLNQTITARYGVPGLKEAMRYRDVPAGHVRAPHEPLKGDAVDEIHSLVDGALQPERA